MIQPTPSAQSLDGYFWTIADQRIEWCPKCVQSRPTYCEVDENNKRIANVRCCTCQRTIRVLNV